MNEKVVNALLFISLIFLGGWIIWLSVEEKIEKQKVEHTKVADVVIKHVGELEVGEEIVFWCDFPNSLPQTRIWRFFHGRDVDVLSGRGDTIHYTPYVDGKFLITVDVVDDNGEVLYNSKIWKGKIWNLKK